MNNGVNGAFARRALTKNPNEISNISFSDNILTIRTCVCTHNENLSGGKLLKVPVPGSMTIELASVATNVIRVRLINHRTTKDSYPFAIKTKPINLGAVEENEDEVIFKSSMLEAHISKDDNFSIKYYYMGNLITSMNSNEGGAGYRTGSGVSRSYTVDSAVSYTTEALSFGPDDNFYGLGADGTTILLNGKSLTVDNRYSEGSGIAHCTGVPFYLSTAKYGVFVNTIASPFFSFGGEFSSEVTFGVPGEELEYYIFAGNSMQDVLSMYTQLSGIPAPVPSWSFGTSIIIDDDFEVTDKEILDYIDNCFEKNIHISELHLGNSWLGANDKLGFTFDAKRFPDPGFFLRKLHDKNVRIGLGVNPYVSEISPSYKECLDCNYLIKNSNGSVYMRDCQCPGTALLDFTHIAARSWLQLKLDNLLKLGVDFFEADFKYGLFDFDDNVVFYDSSKRENVNNCYAELFNQAVYDTVSINKGAQNTMIIAESASAGSHIYPYQNCCVYNASFGSLYGAIKRGLSFGMSGFGYCNIDIPHTNDDNLFLRWLQVATLVPHFRISTSTKYECITDKKPEILSSINLLLKMREGLAPYLFSAAAEASINGTPVMRTMSLEFPNDPAMLPLDRQFMLGQSIMVAPILSENGFVSYYVPAGCWTNLLTREKIIGPVFRKETFAKDLLPVLVRPGSIITTATPDSAGSVNFTNNVTFTVFELSEGIVAAAEIFNNDIKHSGIINILKQDNKITVRTDGFGATKRIVLSGVKNVVSVSESMPQINDWGTAIDFSGKELIITLG